MTSALILEEVRDIATKRFEKVLKNSKEKDKKIDKKKVKEYNASIRSCSKYQLTILR